MPSLDDVSAYIYSQWEATVRRNIQVPYIVTVPVPHTVPSSSGNFQALFYWDTYFTNLGLLRSGRLDLARSNCEALLWWIDQKGFVPNSAFIGDDNRSQPPLLSAMVREVFVHTPDTAWLRAALPRLEREYQFWIDHRHFPNGLAHFGHQASDVYLERFYNETLRVRLGLSQTIDRKDLLSSAGHYLAEAESGQDFTPVYQGRAMDFADVKLNCLLADFEANLAFFHQALGSPSSESATWSTRSQRRQEAINRELWDASTGLYRAKDIFKNAFAPVAHLETFYPLWAGLASNAQARSVYTQLPLFERAWGLAQTEPYTGLKYQWAYPNGWPPTQWIVARGLQRYGFEDAARRIANKYCEAQRRMFAQSGHLWEKYNVLTGEPAHEEYTADPMLGWTAGVFLAMREILN